MRGAQVVEARRGQALGIPLKAVLNLVDHVPVGLRATHGIPRAQHAEMRLRVGCALNEGIGRDVQVLVEHARAEGGCPKAYGVGVV